MVWGDMVHHGGEGMGAGSQSQLWDPEPKALHTLLGLSSQREPSREAEPNNTITLQVNSVLQRGCLLQCPIASGTSTTSWEPCIHMQETVGDFEIQTMTVAQAGIKLNHPPAWGSGDYRPTPLCPALFFSPASRRTSTRWNSGVCA